MNIFENQEQLFIHAKLENDAAYIWSIENDSLTNMILVLRAHTFTFTYEAALSQLEIAKTF